MQNGQEMSAVYDQKAILKETELEIKISELPAAAVQYIQKNYKAAKIKEAAKITKANGEITYEAEVNKRDLIFDASGKFVNEEN